MSDSTTTPKIDLSTFEQRSDHRHIRAALRRQCMRNWRIARAAGTDKSPYFGQETTIGDIARSVKMDPQLVADHLEDAWLVILDRDDNKPVETWVVSEDGE